MATSYNIERSAIQYDIDRSQELQDRGIKREFLSMRTYMDKRFELIDDRFEEQRTYTDERLKEQRSYMDDRFQQVDDRFQQVEALMVNSKAASSWHNIVPIRMPNSLAVPPNFPNKVVKFWRLQRPRNQPQLVELLRFYGIRASDLTTPISEDEEEEESDSPVESQSTLEDAVREDPTFALAHLAARLGLDYGNIHHSMGLNERIQQVRAEQAALRTKREQSEEDGKDKDLERSAKKAATSPDILPQRNRLGIPIEVLAAGFDDFSYKSPTILSHVSWAHGPVKTADSPTSSRVSGSSSKKRATTPSEPSVGGSTIPHTQLS